MSIKRAAPHHRPVAVLTKAEANGWAARGARGRWAPRIPHQHL